MKISLKGQGKKGFFAGTDQVLNLAVFMLLLIGIVLVYAATRDWFAANGLDPEYYLKRQIVNVIIGIALAYGTTLVDYRLLRAYTPFLWGKISIIVGMALILSERMAGEDRPSDRQVLQALGVAALPIILIVAQPDLGTVLIISAAVITMIALSGASLYWVIGLLIAGVVGVYIAIESGEVSEYQLNRLKSFVDPSADPQASGYQLRQARITIGSGGLLGKGLFDGPQTNGRFVPEQQTDFIFTVAGEELGFLGSSFILLLYFIVLMRAFAIARATTDLFGKMVCIGVVAWFSFQIFENIGMTMGLMPMTGVPLLFLSYGGSAMFANLIAIGLLQNVYQRTR